MPPLLSLTRGEPRLSPDKRNQSVEATLVVTTPLQTCRRLLLMLGFLFVCLNMMLLSKSREAVVLHQYLQVEDGLPPTPGANLTTTPMDATAVAAATIQQQLANYANDTAPILNLGDHSRIIEFMHIGKTGGTTIDQIFFLQFKCHRMRFDQKVSHRKIAECFKNIPKRKGALYNGMGLNFHLVAGLGGRRNMDCLANPFITTFLFTVRNPILRALSSYNFLHFNNTDSDFAQRRNSWRDFFYQRCFPRQTDLLKAAVDLLYHPDDNPHNVKECHKRAAIYLRGTGGKPNRLTNVHLYFNNEYYYNMSLARCPEKEVMVVRQESLQDDLSRLDRAVGGQGTFPQAVKHTRRNIMTATHRDSDLTGDETRALCCLLYREVYYYQKIIQRAVNLTPLEKQASIQEMVQFCDISTAQDYFYTWRQHHSDGDDGAVPSFAWDLWARQECPPLLEEIAPFTFPPG